MRKSAVAGKYVDAELVIYEICKTAVKCPLGVTEDCKVEGGLHQESNLSSFLFAAVMDRLSEEVR